MTTKTYSTEAIILSRRNFGEADRLLTIFTKHYGKLRVIAKGVRRPTSRKRGSLDTFTLSRLLLAKGKSLDLIIDAASQESFDSWRKDLLRVGIAYHLCEVVEKMTAENQENRVVFNLLVDRLSSLAKIDYWDLYKFTFTFKILVLTELGYLNKEKEGEVDFIIEETVGKPLKTQKFLKRLTSFT